VVTRPQWLTPVNPPGYSGGEIRRIFEVSPGKQFERLPLQNNQSKMDWWCGSKGRAPVLQAGSPQFKIQSHKEIRR
jgi:hypothetical protein